MSEFNRLYEEYEITGDVGEEIAELVIRLKAEVESNQGFPIGVIANRIKGFYNSRGQDVSPQEARSLADNLWNDVFE